MYTSVQDLMLKLANLATGLVQHFFVEVSLAMNQP